MSIGGRGIGRCRSERWWIRGMGVEVSIGESGVQS